MANILIVEDTVDLGDLLYVFITGAGHRVTLCREAFMALDKLQEENFDLIITDMFMPGRDGLDVLREARRVSPDTPVLVMSGGSRLFPSFDPLSCARQLGAVGVLAKPFRRSDLLSSISAALGTARADASTPRPLPAGSAKNSTSRRLSS
tara:strand:- start:1984 stop:2433 length:450 start_codon:yes stop_codon:yes gene_type:complete